MLPRSYHLKGVVPQMKRSIALLTCLALMIPGAAVASANSTNDSYGLSGVHNVSASKTPTSSSADTGPISASTSTGSLPFTGLDLGALGAGAVVLLGAGVGLRRFSATSR